MARTRGFETQQVVDAALDRFWAGSYATTSTDDLCAGTGLSRSSLYNAFDGKADLYRQGLRRYCELRDSEARSHVESAGNGRQRLSALLTDVLLRQQQFDDRRSCLLVNAAVEIGRSDETVADLARAGLGSFRAVLTALVAAGQRDGSLRRDQPAEDLAVVVHATLNGLQVARRVTDEADDGAGAVETLLGLLDPLPDDPVTAGAQGRP